MKLDIQLLHPNPTHPFVLPELLELVGGGIPGGDRHLGGEDDVSETEKFDLHSGRVQQA